jgi:hypothetical protein
MVGKVGFEPTTSTSRTLRAKPPALLPENIRTDYKINLLWKTPDILSLSFLVVNEFSAYKIRILIF